MKLSDLMVQVQEVGREIEARIDTRVRHAQRLLDDAARVLEALDAKIVEARAAGTPADPTSDGLFATEPPSGGGQFVDETDESSSSEPQPAVTRDPHEAEIARRSADGESPEAIAQAVDRPLGEVQLILSLIESKKRNAS